MAEGINATQYEPKNGINDKMPCAEEGCKGRLTFQAEINNNPHVRLYECDTCKHRYYVIGD